MGEIELGGARLKTGLQAYTKLIAGGGGVEAAHRLAEELGERAHLDVGPALQPIGLHDADGGVLLHQQQTVAAPEIDHLRPHLLGRALDQQPALIAVSLEAEVIELGQHLTACRSLGCAADSFAPGGVLLIGGGSAGGNGHGILNRRAGEIGRDLQIVHRLLLGTVGTFGIGEEAAA